MSTARIGSQTSGSGEESGTDNECFLSSDEFQIPPREDSSCYELPDIHKPVKSPEDYEKFVECLIEVLTLTVNIAPCQITSLAKLAVDMMLAKTGSIYTGLHETFISSIRKFDETEGQQVENKLAIGKERLNPKKVGQQKNLAEKLSEQLDEALKVFDEFKAINEVDEPIKREIESQIFARCAKSISGDPKALMKRFEDLILKLKKTEITIETFLLLKTDFAKNIACSLLIQEIEFALGSDLVSSIYGKLSLDFVENIKKEIKRRTEEFEKYQVENENKRRLIADLKKFGTAIEKLRDVTVDYCSVAGMHHVETMSILAINILMARNLDELTALVVQMECYMGKKAEFTGIGEFKELFLNDKGFQQINLIARKLKVQSACLRDIGYTQSAKYSDKLYKPLSLIEPSRLNELDMKFMINSNGASQFKKWSFEDRNALVSKFMLETIVAKTRFLMSLEKQALESFLKRAEQVVKTILQKVTNNALKQSEAEHDFESENGQICETGLENTYLGDENQTDIREAEMMEIKKKNKKDLSDI